MNPRSVKEWRKPRLKAFTAALSFKPASILGWSGYKPNRRIIEPSGLAG